MPNNSAVAERHGAEPAFRPAGSRTRKLFQHCARVKPPDRCLGGERARPKSSDSDVSCAAQAPTVHPVAGAAAGNYDARKPAARAFRGRRVAAAVAGDSDCAELSVLTPADRRHRSRPRRWIAADASQSSALSNEQLRASTARSRSPTGEFGAPRRRLRPRSRTRARTGIDGFANLTRSACCDRRASPRCARAALSCARWSVRRRRARRASARCSRRFTGAVMARLDSPAHPRRIATALVLLA